MSLIKEFEKTGNWLFRWRSYLPVVLLAVPLLAMDRYEYFENNEELNNLWQWVCLGVSAWGLLIRIFTICHTPEATSGRNTKEQIAETLNTSGIYSIVRNPLYLGNFFIILGGILIFHQWIGVLIYILIFWLYYERIIFAEEAYLIKKFGKSYLDWSSKTPAFIPKFWQYRKAEFPFSIRRILRQEYNSLLGIIIVMFGLEVFSEWFVEGNFHAELEWKILLAVGFILWLITRTLRKLKLLG